LEASNNFNLYLQKKIVEIEFILNGLRTKLGNLKLEKDSTSYEFIIAKSMLVNKERYFKNSDEKKKQRLF
jgi:hypothetical protein